MENGNFSDILENGEFKEIKCYELVGEFEIEDIVLMEEEEVLIENEMCFKLNIVVLDFFFLVVKEFKETEVDIKVENEEDRGVDYN